MNQITTAHNAIRNKQYINEFDLYSMEYTISYAFSALKSWLGNSRKVSGGFFWPIKTLASKPLWIVINVRWQRTARTTIITTWVQRVLACPVRMCDWGLTIKKATA